MLGPRFIREDHDGADVNGLGIGSFEVGAAGEGDFVLESSATVGEEFLHVLGGLVLEILAEVAVGAGDFHVLKVLRDSDADKFLEFLFFLL